MDFKDFKQVMAQFGEDIQFGDANSFAIALKFGWWDVVISLISDGSFDIHYKGDYPLHRAACDGKLDVVQKLIEMGADIKACGICIFRETFYNGHTHVLEYLFQNGVHLNIGQLVELKDDLEDICKFDIKYYSVDHTGVINFIQNLLQECKLEIQKLESPNEVTNIIYQYIGIQ